MPSLLNAPVRPQRRYKRLTWSALGVALVCLLLVALGRVVLIHRMRLPRLSLSVPGYALSVASTPDGRTVLTGVDSWDYAAIKGHKRTRSIPADVFVWDAASGGLLRRLQGLTVRSNAVTVSPDGGRAFAVGITEAGRTKPGAFHVFAWDIATGQRLWTTESKSGGPLSVSPDGSMIASAGSILRATDGMTLCRTAASPPDDTQSGFTPDSRLLGLIGSPRVNPKTGLQDDSDGGKAYYATTRLGFWHTDTGRLAFDFPFIRVRAFGLTHDGHKLFIACDAGAILNGMDGSVLRRVDMATGKVLWERTGSMNGPSADADAVLNSLAVSPNGKYVVVQSMTGRLIVLDARTGRELFRPWGRQSQDSPNWAQPGGVAFSADGRTLVSRCGSQLLVWDATVLQ